jgi:hypothetical protein
LAWTSVSSDFSSAGILLSRMRRLVLSFMLLCALPVSAEEARGLFVAVGYGGRRMSSQDGRAWENEVRWSDVAADDDNVLFNVAYGLGRFVAVGGGATKGRIVTTRDGKTWRELPVLRSRVATIVFARDRFIAARDGELLCSMDGEKFEAGEKLDWKGSIHARRAAWGDGEGGSRCVIIGDVDLWESGQHVSWRASTSDGSRFTSRALDTPAVRDVAYGSGHWVVVGPDGLIESSHDGQVWRQRLSEPGEDFSRVVWTGTRFLVSGGKTLWASPDGVNWTKLPNAIPCSLAWAQEGMLAIGLLWGGNVFASANFVDWKKLPLPPGPSFEAVAFGAP